MSDFLSLCVPNELRFWQPLLKATKFERKRSTSLFPKRSLNFISSQNKSLLQKLSFLKTCSFLAGTKVMQTRTPSGMYKICHYLGATSNSMMTRFQDLPVAAVVTPSFCSSSLEGKKSIRPQENPKNLLF